MLFKKLLHEGSAFLLEDAGGDAALGMEGTRGKTAKAALLVGAAIHYAPNLGPTDSTGAHDAGFDGDIERGIGHVLSTECLGSRRDSLYLGMSRDVVERLGEVVAASDDLAAGYDDAAYGYFTGIIGSLGLMEGEAHEALIVRPLCCRTAHAVRPLCCKTASL